MQYHNNDSARRERLKEKLANIAQYNGIWVVLVVRGGLNVGITQTAFVNFVWQTIDSEIELADLNKHLVMSLKIKKKAIKANMDWK